MTPSWVFPGTAFCLLLSQVSEARRVYIRAPVAANDFCPDQANFRQLFAVAIKPQEFLKWSYR
jgi:hypothetical protein